MIYFTALGGYENRLIASLAHTSNAANYIFLPTLVFFATGAAFAFAAALGALGALAFFSATTVASSTASVFFAAGLRERRVLGLASSVEGNLPNV